MCGRYLLTSPVEALRQLFIFEQRPNLMPRYNIAISAPTQDVPIVRLTHDGTAREQIMVRWGLVPFWADDLSIGNRLINARCETVHTLRAFREAYRDGAAWCQPMDFSNGRSKASCASRS
jgi:putative SOS response-associated peptidase YedK